MGLDVSVFSDDIKFVSIGRLSKEMVNKKKAYV